FADAVRSVDRRFRMSDSAAHWMAVLAMDQHAHLIAGRLTGGAITENVDDIVDALGRKRVPVLAPSRWLRAVDPLPHSWSVTSDSIAAWVAGQVGAARLVLVKPPGAGQLNDAVDSYFAQALPAGVEAALVGADQIEALRRALVREPSGDRDV